MKYIFLIISFLIVLSSVNAQKKEKKEFDPVVLETNMQGNGLSIEIEFHEGTEIYYPLLAIWVEDMDGDYIQTLYVAESIAKGVFNYGKVKDNRWVRESKRRPAALPYWGHKWGVKANDDFYLPTPENPIVDAYTGATPTGSFILKSKTDKILNDKFRILLEINQSWDWNEYWTNNKFPDDEHYKTSSQPALVYAVEIDLSVEEKQYEMEVIGHSHYSGKDGLLYDDLSTITTALEIIEKVIVRVK